MLVRFLAPLLVLTLPAFARTPADNIPVMHKINGDQVLSLLKEVGDTPRLMTDEVGDPLVHAQADGTHYSVIFYDCETPEEKGKTCGAMQFRTWYRLDVPLSASEINEWNRLSRLGRAYLDDDGDATIEYNVRLQGGVTPQHLREQRDWFLRAIAEFERMLVTTQ